MRRILQLQVPARVEHIAIARLVVSSAASWRRELADDRIDDLKLAVSEACTNAVEANEANNPEAPVTVEVFEDDDCLEIHVSDQGGGFDPGQLSPHPPVTDPQRLNFERGLGIPLIRTLVDDVRFEPSDKGTTVCLALYGGPAEPDASIDLTADA
ncbi:MAG TPA: ATP-binding protein [Acidimicrobiales bacterium]|nr:ATP-binding protein [Acidimicrobiales bacterium]